MQTGNKYRECRVAFRWSPAGWKPTLAKPVSMMDLPNMRVTKTEVKILFRFNRSSKFLTAQRKPSGLPAPDGLRRSARTATYLRMALNLRISMDDES